MENHTTDDRDILELLKEELAFVEQGGYGRSVRTPWLPKSAFQDSLACLNYADADHSHACSECRLMTFVEGETYDKLLASGAMLQIPLAQRLTRRVESELRT